MSHRSDVFRNYTTYEGNTIRFTYPFKIHMFYIEHRFARHSLLTTIYMYDDSSDRKYV